MTLDIASILMWSHLEWEAEKNCVTLWRTIHSRFQKLKIRTDEICCNHSAIGVFDTLLGKVNAGKPIDLGET